jgi:hypothetical protein
VTDDGDPTLRTARRERENRTFEAVEPMRAIAHPNLEATVVTITAGFAALYVQFHVAVLF